MPAISLFDTNALLYIIATKRYQNLDEGNCRILDLAYYEYGNSILNILAKRGSRPSKEEIGILVQAFEQVAGLVPSVRLEARMMRPVIDLAIKESLTFYDASYLYCCANFGYQLITEDGKLKRSAQNNSISVMDTEKWAKASQNHRQGDHRPF